MMRILDHGYLNQVESWGSDRSVIEAARMSTDKGFLGWDPRPCDCLGDDAECRLCEGKGYLRGDRLLLRYLYNNWHHTPFEMAGLIVEVQAPIGVFREWFRHRTQGFNEMSGRYIALPNLNYVPDLDRIMINAGGTNKQAGTISGAAALTTEAAQEWRESLGCEYERQEQFYQDALASGIPKELARMHIGVGRYSRMRATGNLRNWLAFMTLRQASNAQWEIRQYANAVAELISKNFPRTYDLFVNQKESQARSQTLGRRVRDLASDVERGRLTAEAALALLRETC